jgi:hypothetical protein
MMDSNYFVEEIVLRQLFHVRRIVYLGPMYPHRLDSVKTLVTDQKILCP